ncbi:MAG: hypothetical protein H7240_03490 [Glaciimonas sp.]|nr:hypothetical protein [Glaciimonas sp.]
MSKTESRSSPSAKRSVEMYGTVACPAPEHSANAPLDRSRVLNTQQHHIDLQLVVAGSQAEAFLEKDCLVWSSHQIGNEVLDVGIRNRRSREARDVVLILLTFIDVQAFRRLATVLALFSG